MNKIKLKKVAIGAMVLAIVLLGVSPIVVEAEVIDVPVTVSAGGGELNLTKKEIKEELAYQKQLVEKLRNADDNEEKI
ncbi:TPA: hypothetical protein U0C88_000509, partial [Listeria monocytogenes]|nr:hypothetical protein [Listeria monocytogenes]